MAHKVLIIEDDSDIGKLLSVRFRAGGFDVRHVVDAVFGIKEAREFKPEIIILDLMLPGGGGLQVLKQIRLSTYTSQIPVIVYTGMADEGFRNQVAALGVEAYFQKPYDPHKIVEKALEVLGQGTPRQDGAAGIDLAANSTRKKILVIDDEPDLLRIVKAVLENNNYEVVTLSDGTQALRAVEAHRPDLIIVDLMMPGLDGWRVSQKIRLEEKFKDIPILIFSALIDQDQQGPAGNLEVGDFYLAKPFNSAALLAKVKELLLKKN